MTFWSCRKNGLIRKIRLTSKFMTSQPAQQTITINTLLNISRSKDNRAMKFGQVIEDTREIIFVKNHTENDSGKLVPDLFFFRKAL